MKKRLLQALARLASVKYQEMYILGATRDNYALPEDIVEDVASLCSLANRDQYRSKFTVEQLFMLNKMAEAVRKHGKPLFGGSVRLDASALIHRSEDWVTLRQVASECLAVFGTSVNGMTPEEIDEGGNVFEL